MSLNWEIIFAVVVVIFVVKRVKVLDFYFKFVLSYAWVLACCTLVFPYLLMKKRNVTNILPCVAIMKHAALLNGLTFTVRGQEHLNKAESCVLVANHQSSLDLIGMFVVWPIAKRMSAIAKRELMYVGSFGISCWLAGITFIDRQAGGKAGQALNEAMLNLKKEKTKLWVFVEGTRRNTGEIHQFKKGAFHAAIHAQVPIVPVVFSSYRNFLNTKKKIFEEGEVIITALPEIPTIGLTSDDVDDLIERTRIAMISEYNATSEEVAVSIRKEKNK